MRKLISNKKVLYIAACVVAALLILVASFYLLQPSVKNLNQNIAFGDGYSLSLSSEWEHPKQVSSDDNPVGEYPLDDTYAKGECFVVLENYDMRQVSAAPDDDYNFSFYMAYPSGVTVLSSISDKDRVAVPVEGAESIEFIKFKTEDFASYTYTSGNSNTVSLSRGFGDDKRAILIHAGCSKSSNIDPTTLLNEIALASR
jgi:hypothetical protein